MPIPHSIPGHLTMLLDKVRLRLYRRAIAEVVRPGDTVADIGTGTGILAFFAVQAGARKVYAIEQSDVIEDAKRLARLNHWEKKIVFIKGRSDQVALPHRVDVITSEMISSFGLEENVNRYQVDARDRFLKPGGRIVPAWLELYLAPVESKPLWNQWVQVWGKSFHGCDFTPMREYAISQRYVAQCSKLTRPLSSPAMMSRFNFYEIEKPPLSLTTDFLIKRSGALHGLVGYFRTGLSPHVILSTSLKDPLTHWKQPFFPLQEAVKVRKGDVLRCRMSSIPFGDIFTWQWETQVSRKGVTLAQFSQNNFDVSKGLLRMILQGHDFKPVLAPKGKVAHKILSLCDGRRTLEQIARILRRAYPQEFNDGDQTLQAVVGAVRTYAKM